MLQQTLVNHSLYFGITNTIHEIADSSWRISTTTQTTDGRHTRIIPACHQTFLDELQHLTLRHDGISDIESVELTLFRTIVGTIRTQSAEVSAAELVDKIVVQRTMHLKLKCTDRVRYAFEIIGLTVCKVIHRIDVPFASGTMMRMRGDNTIHDRITEMHVRVCHVDLCTQNHLAFLYLASLHCLEETQVLLDGTITVRRSHTGLGRRTFLLRNLLGCLFIHIGLAFFDETDSEVIELLEIIGGIENMSPFETKPANIALDGLYVFGILLGRVRVVKTEVTNTIVFLGNTEVHTYRLDVSDMQVSVRLRRETRLNTSTVHSLCKVFLYYLLNKIETFFLNFHIFVFYYNFYALTTPLVDARTKSTIRSRSADAGIVSTI